MSKVNIVMDASQFDLFRLCECRFNYRYNLHKVTPTKAKPLDRGGIIHLGNEIYYEALKNGAKYDFAVNSALLKMKAAGVESDLENNELNHIIDTMEEYYDYWRAADQSFEIVAVESPFMYDLFEDDHVRIIMAGKIDLLINDNQYQNLPYDHKSFSRSGEVNRLSNQFQNYCIATNSNYLVVNRIGLQKTLKPHDKFLRVPLSYDHLILEEWKANTVKVLMYYLDCVVNNSWPMNLTSCDKYNRRCEYYDVCDSSGIEAKLFKLGANYVDEVWDVTKVLQKASEQFNIEKDETNGN